MTTRIIHQVRCRNPNDSQMFVDMAVVDGIAFLTPGGQEVLISTLAKEAEVFIKDDTGDDNGIGNSKSASRISHMERVHGTDDDKQKFDIEVLDGFALWPPMIDDPSDEEADNQNLWGLIDSGRYGGAQIALLMPNSQASRFIVDKVGLGLETGTDPNNTRSGHINLVTEKGNTDDKTDGIKDAGDSIPPTELSWAACFKIDAIAFRGPNNNEILLGMPFTGIDEIDRTKMTTDPDTGEPCPPDNTDPNVYIGWPKDSESQGTNVGIPMNEKTGKVEPIDMGVLWYIKKVSPSFNPWFWFATVQTPKAFSFFGSPGRLGSWGYRGFVLFNYFPVIWILSANSPLRPMGDFGSPSLDLCAREGNWDTALPPVPSPYFGIADGPFGPFGLLSMTHVALGPAPNGSPYGAAGDGSQIWDGRPNVWQLTGLKQPDRFDMTKPWDAHTNPNRFPTKKDAKACAELFRDNWNSVADGHNAFIQGYVPGPDDPKATYAQPPGWHWAIPWYDGFIGRGNSGYPSEGYGASFQNGIPPGVATHLLPLEVYAPATSWNLDVDQLDPALWDTTKLEFTKNPINYDLPFVDPPKLWTSEHH